VTVYGRGAAAGARNPTAAFRSEQSIKPREGTSMLFCISANYTPKAMEAMGKNPKTNRQAAVEKLLTDAGAQVSRDVLHYRGWSWCDGDLRRRPGLSAGDNGSRRVNRRRSERQATASVLWGRSSCNSAKKSTAPEVL
jgi:hypothetical protein